MNTAAIPAPRSALREPMMWLVIALPLAAVVAGFVTLGYAVRSASDPVRDDVKRVAQIQTTNLAADERAAALKLVATVTVDARSDAAQVVVAGLAGDAASAVLRFEHPVDASRDAIVSLARRGDGALVGTAPLVATRYNLTLLAADASWRLRGRLENGASTAALSPQVSRTGT